MKKILLFVMTAICSLTASAQWTDDSLGVQPVTVGTTDYGNEHVVGVDGTIWYFYYHPSANGYEQCLQAIDKDGNKLFGDNGMVVSCYANNSYTVVGQWLYANSDSTVTVVIRDRRNAGIDESFLTYTAYRYNTKGEQLWGEDGVNLDENMQVDFTGCMTFCELSDGSTAFAWQRDYGDGQCVEIQKVSKDGKCLYKLDDTRLCKTNGYYVYPYMVPSDNGSFIIVYGNTSSYYLRAMKFNNDGTQAWTKAVDVYKGGWGSVMSLQSRMKVFPGPDYGIIVTWNADIKNDGFYSPYIAYIKKDGTSQFTNSDGKPYIKLSYDEQSAYPPSICISPDSTEIYTIFCQFNQGAQQWQEITLQKINMDGELCYGDSGVYIKPLQAEESYGEASVQMGADGQVGCFYEIFHDYHNIKNCLSIRNTNDGSAVNEEQPEIMWSASEHYRTDLQSTRLSDNTWLVFWMDDVTGSGYDSETRSHCFYKMNFDGSIYTAPTGINKVLDNDNASSNMNHSSYYNLAGQRVTELQKGTLYIQNGKKFMK